MEKITFKGKIIEVVEQEVEQAGKKLRFEFARRSPGVRLIIPRGDSVLITKEFRYELGEHDYRLPGDKVFDTLDAYNAALKSGVNICDAAEQAAIKEAREEAGIEVKELSLFHTSVCGATVVWDLFYFLVKNFDDAKQHLEAGEDITFEWVSREAARGMCLDGSIREERSALVLLRYLSNS
ncbi:NUDIX domain-containing protein [Candidatus Kaiserbacteria bacterium]|nr:NUDIX domain-containing protein [Candidatus Kaiserbacteria bacterium]